MTKACSVCGSEKLLKDFSKDDRNKDGRGARCKACTSEHSRAHYLKNKKYILKKHAEWKSDNKDRNSAINKKYRLAHMGAYRDATARYRVTHPGRCSAGTAVRKALRAGVLVKQPCSRCGADKSRTVAHHHSYLDPLKVIWLCRSCHCRLHQDIRNEAWVK